MNHLTRNDDAGAAPLPVRPEAWRPDLTPREREVVGWLASGKTDAEIASLLAISPRTVQKHLEHVYVKLGVETRTAAVMRTLAVADPGVHLPPTAGRPSPCPPPRQAR